ncbi:MAG: 1,4-dihydroxy-6-naphthoate synthase [Planctomycetota bacterium]|jgi:1,4-dihydroxy-6-naphthoate synthase
MSSEREIRFGFSPCPNDTFMFHALVSGQVKVPGMRVIPELMDIEELNRRALGKDPLELSKLSLGALSELGTRYRLLDAGAALGHGVGPLLVCREQRGELVSLGDLHGARIAIPGRLTTACLLMRRYGPPGWQPVEMRFDRIMPAVTAGEVDAGVVIHEGRFTYAVAGLRRLADLGKLWESDKNMPLALGVIAARTDLGEEFATRLEKALRASVVSARKDPLASRDYVREHAQELDEEVCRQHIDLYVNARSESLGPEGRQAIEEMLRPEDPRG